MAIKQAIPLLRVADVARAIEWYRNTLGFVGDPFRHRRPMRLPSSGTGQLS